MSLSLAVRTTVSTGAQVMPVTTGLGGYGAGGRAGSAATVTAATRARSVSPARRGVSMAHRFRGGSAGGDGRDQRVEERGVELVAVAHGDQVQAGHDEQDLVAGP